jgi:hypothetical protein
MFRRTTPSTDDPADSTDWRYVPGQPHDRCFRCGRPTPPGVSLCERDNPARVKGPSATQVHGTIAVGVIGGFIGFMLLVAALSGGVGPFSAEIIGQVTRADGGLEVVVRVANEGSRVASASCRVSRGGVQGANDLVFFTEPIPAEEAREFARAFPPAPDAAPVREPGALAVRCN